MQSLGIIGFGSFGQFAVKWLKPHFDISVYDVCDKEDVASELGVKWSTLEDTCNCEIVIIGVPLEFLERVLKKSVGFLNPGSLVMDVTSVKIKPAKLMAEILPDEIDVIATHPLFGPKSGKNGIEGLNIALCNVRGERFNEVADFCREVLKLKVIETTPEKHDQEAGYVMGLTHFIGQALNMLEVPECSQTTSSFEHLMELKDLLSLDSMDLFRTIQKDNPFAEKARKDFMQKLQDLEDNMV
jgi:prephenate dehydrogenase